MERSWLFTLALAVISAACTGKRQGDASTKIANEADGGSSPSTPLANDAPMGEPWRFFALGMDPCLSSHSGGALCGHLRRADGDGGVTMALTFRPVAAVGRLTEAAAREACFRTSDGIAFCDGREVARGVKSVAGAPYLLRADGSLVIARRLDSEGNAIDTLREAVSKKLPLLARLVATEHATCGLSTSSEVWCWSEPTYPFGDPAQVPVAPQPSRVPLTDVVDITLMPWLTLCARTRGGVVLCSPAPSRTTEVCVLRGKSDVRCGPQMTGLKGPPDLAGDGYDPRRVLDRALVRVPGVEDAVTLAAYAQHAYQNGESSRRVYESGFDEGGCAQLASGGVRCWERDRCATGAPWQSAPVEGLPPTLSRIALGAHDGYATTEAGALYTWSRRSPRGYPPDDCTKPHAFSLRAERVVLNEPVVDVVGGTFVVEAEPIFMGIDCATLRSGKVTCFRTEELHKEPIDVSLVE